MNCLAKKCCNHGWIRRDVWLSLSAILIVAALVALIAIPAVTPSRSKRHTQVTYGFTHLAERVLRTESAQDVRSFEDLFEVVREHHPTWVRTASSESKNPFPGILPKGIYERIYSWPSSPNTDFPVIWDTERNSRGEVILLMRSGAIQEGRKPETEDLWGP